MRFYIGLLPDDNFRQSYRRIVSDLASQFNLEELSRKNRNPHITIKSPVELLDISPIGEMLGRYRHSVNDLTTVVRNIGFFDEEQVIHFIIENPAIADLAARVLTDLRGLDLDGMSWDRFDSAHKTMHITLAKGDELDGKSGDVLHYLIDRGFNLELRPEALALFRKEDGRTTVHSTYPLF